MERKKTTAIASENDTPMDGNLLNLIYRFYIQSTLTYYDNNTW